MSANLFPPQFTPNWNIPQPLTQPLSALTTQQPSQLLRVNGIESAKAYPTAPNSMYALFDENDDVMYIKTTDASNFPTIKRYRFVEEAEAPKIEEQKYVTVEEFNQFKEEMLHAQQSVYTKPASNNVSYAFTSE